MYQALLLYWWTSGGGQVLVYSAERDDIRYLYCSSVFCTSSFTIMLNSSFDLPLADHRRSLKLELPQTSGISESDHDNELRSSPILVF